MRERERERERERGLAHSVNREVLEAGGGTFKYMYTCSYNFL